MEFYWMRKITFSKVKCEKNDYCNYKFNIINLVYLNILHEFFGDFRFILLAKTINPNYVI